MARFIPKTRLLEKISKPTVLGWLHQVSICVCVSVPCHPPLLGEGSEGAWCTTVLLLLEISTLP